MYYQADIDEYLDGVVERFLDAGLDCTENEPWEGKTLWWAADRTDYLGFRRGYRIHAFQLVGFESLDWLRFREYCESC